MREDFSMVKLLVMNRAQVEALSAKRFNPHTMLISIHDYGDDSAKITHLPEFYMSMEFNDVDSDVYTDAYGKSLSAIDKKAAEKKYHPLDNYQARRFVKFYFKVKDKAEIIICQCEYGESRSAAVAAAISEYESKAGLKYFIDDKYCPNKFVFKKIYNALCKEGAK